MPPNQQQPPSHVVVLDKRGEIIQDEDEIEEDIMLKPATRGHC